MKNLRFLLIIAFVALVVFAVGCETTSEADTGNDPVATNEVTITDNAFSPSSIVVAPGTTVTWYYNASAVHTVTSGERGNPDGMFDSGDLSDSNNGQIFQYTFTSAGTFPYYCVYHAGMNGTVTVQ